MNVTWFGQGGFLLEQNGCRLVVDPYLSDHLAARGFERSFSSPVAPQALNADFIVCTHDHGDHFDPDTVLPAVVARPNTVVLGPASVAKHGADLGLSVRQIGIGHDAATLGPFRLHAIPAHHSDPDAVGLLIEVGGQRIYVSGDSAYADDLVPAALAHGAIDLLLICINGKFGNMTAAEAVKVAFALRPRLSIPIHYGLFAINTADPETFLEPVRALGLAARELPLAAPVPILPFHEMTVK